MNNATKFKLALVVTAFQMLIFVAILIFAQSRLDATMVIAFISAPIATLTAFGLLNVVASGQAAKVAIAQAAPNATVESPVTTIASAAGAEKEKEKL